MSATGYRRHIRTRILKAVRSAIRPGLVTTWWMVRLTVVVSLAVSILQYVGVIALLARWLNPLFNIVGLPGEAALAFISGYFVSIYSAVATAITLNMDIRAINILAVMCLCAHNIIIETAVQKQTGSSALRMILLRTISALVSALVLHLLLPAGNETSTYAVQQATAMPPLKEFALHQMKVTGWLTLRMFVLIMSLNILQKLLAEFGVIRLLSKLLRPVLKIFGLPAKTSFLWIVANILGLAYGAAVMMEEVQQNKINKKDADLLNHHIAISHSNLEDVSLFLSIGAGLWWMLLPRWILAAIVVWLRRWELRIRHTDDNPTHLCRTSKIKIRQPVKE
ncbi:MAG: nucleoside recognition protein [Bacteroidales bacterium]|jgi:hypothetical protein|nr:nucleoside recognition protein [Bacteroidales bacterium]